MTLQQKLKLQSYKQKLKKTLKQANIDELMMFKEVLMTELHLRALKGDKK